MNYTLTLQYSSNRKVTLHLMNLSFDKLQDFIHGCADQGVVSITVEHHND